MLLNSYFYNFSTILYFSSKFLTCKSQNKSLDDVQVLFTRIISKHSEELKDKCFLTRFRNILILNNFQQIQQRFSPNFAQRQIASSIKHKTIRYFNASVSDCYPGKFRKRLQKKNIWRERCINSYLLKLIIFNDIITAVMIPNRLKLGLKGKEGNTRRLIPQSAINKNRSEAENADISLLLSKKPSFDETPHPSSSVTTSSIQLLSSQTISHPTTNTSSSQQIASSFLNDHFDGGEKQQLSRQLNDWKQKAMKSSKQNQQLLNRYKIIEAELQNTDRQYYERQITRLRNECQSLQIERVGIIHKVQQFTEQKVAYQSAMRKKNDQIRNASQQLEKQKSSVTDLKNQLGEREKALRYALEQAQKANQMLHKKLSEGQTKCTRIQIQSKDQASIISSLQIQLQTANTRLKDAQSIAFLSRKRYQQNLSQKQVKIQSITNEYNKKVLELETNVSKQRLQIYALKQQLRSTEISQTSLHLKGQQSIIEKDAIIRSLNIDLADRERLLLSSQRILDDVQSKLRQSVPTADYQRLQQKYQQLEKKGSTCSSHLQQLKNYQQQIQILKIQLLSSKSNPSSSSFEQTLKKTLQTNATLKQELLSRVDTIDKLKQQLQQSSSKEKQLSNQIQFLIRKNSALTKNSSIELQVQGQKMVNESQSIRRKLMTIQARLQAKIKENKQKDDFIKSQIIGKAGNDAPRLLSQLQRIFIQRDRLQEQKISEVI